MPPSTLHPYRPAAAEPGTDPARVWCADCNRTPAEHADEDAREARCLLLGHDFDTASPGVLVCDDCKLVRELDAPTHCPRCGCVLWADDCAHCHREDRARLRL